MSPAESRALLASLPSQHGYVADLRTALVAALDREDRLLTLIEDLRGYIAYAPANAYMSLRARIYAALSPGVPDGQ